MSYTPNYVPKRLDIARRAQAAAGQYIRSVEELQAIAALLAQSGGNFADGDPGATPAVPGDWDNQSDLAYAEAYNFNLLLQVGAATLAGKLGDAIDGAQGPPIGTILRKVMGA